MSKPKLRQTLRYAYEADKFLRQALPFSNRLNRTRYLHLLQPSNKDSGYFDFSNFIRLGIVTKIAHEQEGFYATYFHEHGHLIHYTTTESPFVTFEQAQKNHALFKKLLDTAFTGETFKQLKHTYPPGDFLDYITSEPEIIARMIESYCLHYHDLVEKTAKNRMPHWQFTKEEVQHVPQLLQEICTVSQPKQSRPTTFTVYLDFDGVLVTKFSDGNAFDPICVKQLSKLLTTCKKQVETLQLCIISNWRFDKTVEEITALLHDHALLEHVDVLHIPTDFTDREQQILHHHTHGHFIILDDQAYQHRYLIHHHIQLRAEDGLRGLEVSDIKRDLLF